MSLGTLSDLLFHVREVSSGRPELLAADLGGRRETLSTADFLRGVHSLALGLEARGLSRGERVAIFSENRPEWHVADFACRLLGAVTVPLAPDLAPEQVGFVLRNSASRRVFYSDAPKRELLVGLASTLTSPPELAAFDAGVAPAGETSITRLMGDGAPHLGDVPLERFRGRVQERDAAGLSYVPGPAGDLERREVSHGELIADLLACDRAVELSPADVAVSLAPLAERVQQALDHLSFYRGAAIRYAPPGDEVPMAALHLERPTVLTAPAALYERAYGEVEERIRRDGRPGRRLVRWGLAVGRRHQAAARSGFVGPLLGLQRLLAERMVYRDLRRHFGGRLRTAIAVEPLAPEVAEFFAAWGVGVTSGSGLLA